MESTKEKDVTEWENKGPIIAKRHIQSVLMCFCMAIEISSRYCLTLSIVAMTEHSSPNPNIPIYNWTDSNVILSSFYWGYLTLQLPAGYVSKIFGVKWLVFGAMIVNSFVTVIIPYSASSMGSTGVMICRIFQGCAQGFFVPCVSTMLGRWAPQHERSRLLIIIYTGASIGKILSNPINGLISESYYGWPATFYLFGGTGFAWCILWLIFGYSTPSTHPYITLEEKIYIEKSLSQKHHERDISIPWMAMFSCKAFWAVVIGIMGGTYSSTFLSNEEPSYLRYVVGYSIETDGILSSTPTIVAVLTSFLMAPLSDYVVRKGYISTLNSRRIFQLCSSCGNAVFMLVLAYLPKSKSNMAIILLILHSVFGAGTHFGALLNVIDISPRFSGIIMGFSNGLGSAASLFGPLLVQFLITDEANAAQWRILFIIAAGWYFIPAALFSIFASGKVQWWDSGYTEEETNEEKQQNIENRKISGSV